MSKIPYDLSLIKGVVFDIDGVLSPCVVPLGADGNPCRMANIKDGYALQLAVRNGLHIAVISGAMGDGLIERFRNLGITEVFLKAGMKKNILVDWMSRYGLAPDEVAYVGDDVPDRECMETVGLPVAPADSAPDILAVAGYISPCNGGYGVARDLLEEILRAQCKWPVTDKACGW